jgi:OOP family OmpA-OmpF porin
MRKTKLLSSLLLAATLGAAAFGAQAQDAEKGFYAGAGVGQSFVDEGNYDDEDTAFSAFGGYQFNKYFALEAGYADFGEIESSRPGQPSLEGDTAYFTAVGIVPITEKFSAYGKAGLHRWNLDQAIPSLTSSTDDSGSDPTYGLGVQYRFTDRVALRGEYSRFEIEDLDADLAQVQLRIDF